VSTTTISMASFSFIFLLLIMAAMFGVGLVIRLASRQKKQQQGFPVIPLPPADAERDGSKQQ
jgi:hypothetical protein